MTRLSRRLLGAVAAIATAGAVASAGLTAAAASPAAPGRSGTEHLQLVIASPTARVATVIATGVFTGGGTNALGPGGQTVALVRFAGGTMKIAHSAGRGHQSFNPRTCLFSLSLHGTFRISHGTGKYAGISGHGTYQLTVLEIAARAHGKCSQTKAPVAFQQVIRAQGPVRL